MKSDLYLAARVTMGRGDSLTGNDFLMGIVAVVDVRPAINVVVAIRGRDRR